MVGSSGTAWGDVFSFFLFFLWPYGMWDFMILVPQPGIEPALRVVEAQSLNHWATREVSVICFGKAVFQNLPSSGVPVICECPGLCEDGKVTLES